MNEEYGDLRVSGLVKDYSRGIPDLRFLCSGNYDDRGGFGTHHFILQVIPYLNFLTSIKTFSYGPFASISAISACGNVRSPILRIFSSIVRSAEFLVCADGRHQETRSTESPCQARDRCIVSARSFHSLLPIQNIRHSGASDHHSYRCSWIWGNRSVIIMLPSIHNRRAFRMICRFRRAMYRNNNF